MHGEFQVPLNLSCEITLYAERNLIIPYAIFSFIIKTNLLNNATTFEVIIQLQLNIYAGAFLGYDFNKPYFSYNEIVTNLDGFMNFVTDMALYKIIKIFSVYILTFLLC